MCCLLSLSAEKVLPDSDAPASPTASNDAHSLASLSSSASPADGWAHFLLTRYWIELRTAPELRQKLLDVISKAMTANRFDYVFIFVFFFFSF